MDNLKLLIGVIAGTLVLIVGVAFLFSGDNEAASGLDVSRVRGEARHVRVASELTEGEESTPSAGLAEGEESTPSGGLTEGMVELVEFSDFQCPACQASQEVVEAMLAKYPGQLALIYRHFPLESIHRYAFRAAVASEAAGEEGKFFEYHDLLYLNQVEWAEADDVDERLIAYALELGLDEQRFREQLESQDLEARVRADMDAGRGLGINSTPTFYVNGKKVSVLEIDGEVSSLVQ